MRHSVYVLNRLPTRALPNYTPYEAGSSKKPDIGHIIIFGCLAYMKVPSVYIKKLDDRSKAVMDLGKEPGTEAHHMYDPKVRRVYVCRDVVFEKSKSWNWNA